MFNAARTHIEQRIQRLEEHLRRENPILLNVVHSFREIDRIAYRMGLLPKEDSFAMQVPWWPVVAILGTFSSGKSTFINSYLKIKMQRTGNQAVDDKFTVISFSRENQIHTLPGIALDADPRFPFYQISSELEAVSAGEGSRLDAYLQLKTCPSDLLKGKILIDSPGFDADAQRTATLRMTDHIIDLSDLVLVFFDARHPEPGAMQDTLTHLVANTIHRHDSNKFVYILNQIDSAAQEDNPEEVVAAWQRALSQAGLTAGRFYQIYNEEAARPIDNESLRVRFQSKRDVDLGDIYSRIQQVEIERAYRVIAVLEQTTRRIGNEIVPKLKEWLLRWRRYTLLFDGVAFTLLAAFLLGIIFFLGIDLVLQLVDNPVTLASSFGILGVVMLYIHFSMRRIASRKVAKQIAGSLKDGEFMQGIKNAFIRSSYPWWRPLYAVNPAGWGVTTQKRLTHILSDTDQFVQNLNDRFTNPSGTVATENKRKP